MKYIKIHNSKNYKDVLDILFSKGYYWYNKKKEYEYLTLPDDGKYFFINLGHYKEDNKILTFARFNVEDFISDYKFIRQYKMKLIFDNLI